MFYINYIESIIDLILLDLVLYYKCLDVKYVQVYIFKIWIINNLELRRILVYYNNFEYKIFRIDYYENLILYSLKVIL